MSPSKPVRMSERLRKVREDKLHALILEAYAERRNGSRHEPDGHVKWERTHVRWRDRYYYYP